MTRLSCLALLAFFTITPALAAEPLEIGLTADGTLIEGWAVEAVAENSQAPTVLLIGGLSGPDEHVAQVQREVERYEARRPTDRTINLLAIPLANPNGVPLQFPPTGVAYRENAEANALWRWIGLHAPDLVLIAGDKDHGLAEALAGSTVAEVGRIPARVVPGNRMVASLDPRSISPSPAHREMTRRYARTPRELAEELGQYYGRDFDVPWYIQAIALIAQIRLGHLEEVERLAEPYVDGTKDSLARPNSLVLAGHLVFAELAHRTGDARYLQRVRSAADLGFEPGGQMKASMPFHDEYSDSLFMGTVIAAQAGALTGERKYFDLAARHVAFMRKLVLRDDGLYRHSPASDAAWGRGNGFPAIGLALTLPLFPKDHAGFAQLVRDFQAHMAVLGRYQNRDGLWRNVIDHPGAYAEVTATAMIGFSMLQGVRYGWLPAQEYKPKIDAAWHAVLGRIGPEGHVVDACESTLKMKSTEEYLHRAAILGTDARAGAMVMMFATAMAGLD